jgi:Mor family transcriptional regulator
MEDKDKDEALELLEHILGVDGANQYVKFFAGHSFYIPQRIITKQIYHKIRDEFKNGATYRELSFRYGYTERHIRRIIHYKKRIIK